MQPTKCFALTRGLFLAAILAAPAWGQTLAPRAARPGTINYVEGRASLGTSSLNASSVGNLEMERDQVLTTEAGKVEILLTPGVFLRLADNSSLKMISPEITKTEVQLDKGRALIEVVEIHGQNDIQIDESCGTIKLLRKSLYDIDADHHEVRVFNGSAEVTGADRKVTLASNHKLVMSDDRLKPAHLDARQYQDGFYRWSGLRSAYLSEASVSAARSYIGTGPDWYGPGWIGSGWYWNPWFEVYTFLPPAGIIYGGFGWGFYSPIAVYWSPFAYFGNYPHRFGEFHYPYGHGFPPPIMRN